MILKFISTKQKRQLKTHVCLIDFAISTNVNSYETITFDIKWKFYSIYNHTKDKSIVKFEPWSQIDRFTPVSLWTFYVTKSTLQIKSNDKNEFKPTIPVWQVIKQVMNYGLSGWECQNDGFIRNGRMFTLFGTVVTPVWYR